jgi:hypothetical protein
MKCRSFTVLWMVAAFCASLLVASLALAVLGREQGTGMALKLTARLSFLLFWPAYTGSALTALFGPTFHSLKRYAREFGLAFAAALLVHLGLVGWLSYIGSAPAREIFIFFGVAALSTYLMALFSLRSLHQKLGRAGWWLLSTVALNYVAYAFAVDFWTPQFVGSVNHLLGYSSFALLSVAGPVIRLAAFVQRVAYAQRASAKPS